LQLRGYLEPTWRAVGGQCHIVLHPYSSSDYKETNTDLELIRKEVMYSTHKKSIIAEHHILKS